MDDSRQKAARYYDLQPNNPYDVDFYVDRIPSEASTVLELGCGTGRVLVPQADHCKFIQGIDYSAAMLEICREKLAVQSIPSGKADVQLGDISSLDLHRKFDLITAPFRVFQNLDSEQLVEGFFQTVRNHLSPSGSCIITAFRPNSDRDTLIKSWATDEEVFNWEVQHEGKRLTRHHRNAGFRSSPLTVFPELVYRLWDGVNQVDETVLKIAMRVYYPDELTALVEESGFVITNKWGGYAGEQFGEGPELVIEFGF